MSLFPENISTYGQEIDDLFYLIAVPVGIAFLTTLVVLVYPLFKYRAKEGRKASYIKGVGWKQMQLVVIAMILLAISDFYMLYAEHDTWVKIEEELPEPDFKVAITGRQWSWTITYPGKDGELYTTDDVIRVNDLHVPVNAVVHMDIKALDVVHSVFIPNVRFKQDAIPGRTITRWFEATKTGKFDISCAEICGIAHSSMKGTLFVHTQEEFDSYMKSINQ